MREFGICMAGLEDAIEEFTLKACHKFQHVVYLEIGVASGQTLVSVTDILDHSKAKWTSVGVDLPNGYSLEREGILQRANGLGIPAYITELNHSCRQVHPLPLEINVYLKRSQEFLSSNFQRYPISLCLIDGCHGKECVKTDFILLEPLMDRGGIVMFHDFGEDSVGEPQPHCGKGDVLGACRELGLLDGSRNRWKHLATIVGDKEKEGRDLGVFERIG